MFQRSNEGLSRSAEEPLEVVGPIQGVDEGLEVDFGRRRYEGIQFGIGMKVKGEGKGPAGTARIDASEGEFQVTARISTHR